jgi:3-oxoacyl-[acyl-carrier protein] reductase
VITCSIIISTELLPQPDQRENRSIINVSSTTGLHGNVGQINYAAAKAAVVGMSKTIAKEWGPFGVRANTIAFGLVHTRLVIAHLHGLCNLIISSV